MPKAMGRVCHERNRERGPPPKDANVFESVVEEVRPPLAVWTRALLVEMAV